MSDDNVSWGEIKALFAETDRRFKETDQKFKETDLQFKETDIKIQRAFDLFESQWGKLIESLVEGDLIRLLKARGIKIHDLYTRRKGNYQGENYEFDIVAHNGEEIVVVEVKTTLRVKDVNKHIYRLENFKTWIPAYKDLKVYGAIAYIRAEEESEIFAERKKLFVIRATGDSASIINKDDFQPRTF